MMDPVLLKFIDKLLVIMAILAPIMFCIVVVVNYRRYKVRALPSMIFHLANFALFAIAVGGRFMVDKLAQQENIQFTHNGFDLFELLGVVGSCFIIAFAAFTWVLKYEQPVGDCEEDSNDELDYYHGVPTEIFADTEQPQNRSSKTRFVLTLVFAACVFCGFYVGAQHVFDGELASSVQRSLISVATVNILYLILSAAGLILPMSFWGVRKKIRKLKDRKKEEIWEKITELRQNLGENEAVFYIEEAILDHDRKDPRIFLSLEDQDGTPRYITIILNQNGRGLLHRVQRHKVVKLHLTESEHDKFQSGRPTSTFFDRISLH